MSGISFNYDSVSALSLINIDIHKGESVALVGPNGSGKSTLLKVINGICFPSQGEYWFDGSQVTEKALKNQDYLKLFHKRIGFVFQNSDAQLFCATAFEEIAFGPRQIGLSPDEVNERVFDCLNLLQIEHLKHREPYHLSEGEKKKLAIAAVLALNPDVLTLDEPMNNLDVKTRNFLKDLLIKLRHVGKTIICATHEVSQIQDVFGRVISISEDHHIS